MPAGATDANGVYQYGSSDTQPTFHGLLNVGGGVLSTTIAAINSRIAQEGVAAFATLALLLASTGHATGYLAKVTNMPGALFVATSSSPGAWQMHGTPRFASAGARTSAVTTPELGMRSRRDDFPVDEEYNGATWVPTVREVLISTISISGTTFTIDNLPTHFTGFELEIVTEGTAASLAAVLRSTAPADVTSANYDRTTVLGRNATPATATSAGQTSWSIMPIVNTSHHHMLKIEALTQALPTTIIHTGGVNALTAVQNDDNAVFVQRLRQRLSTIYGGIKGTFSASQTGYARLVGKF